MDVIAQAGLGGFLFASTFPFLSVVEQIEAVQTEARVESATNPIEVVLTIDVSQSMEYRLGGRQSPTGGGPSSLCLSECSRDHRSSLVRRVTRA